MGQGYSVINPSAGTAGIEFADLEWERTLAGPRFLKTIRARHKDGLVIAKIYTKPFANLKLDDRVLQLIEERRKLAEVPNALPYHRIVETASSAYLVRQYVHSSLYDRISTNPPLEDIERKWIAFQLLCAVRDCHARNIYHGDIKTENMLLTSWNWLYLTDFAAAVKPWFLPEDNPLDYSLFYDSTPRRICYIAPERFIDAGPEGAAIRQHGLQWAMDIFSVGCVIAELFTEAPLFTLSQLFRYKKGEYDPAQATLASIKDDHIREMVTHMISVDPNDRYSAQEYLDFWQDKAFPLYFYTFLHQYTHLLTDPTSGQTPVALGSANNGGSDDRIDRVYNDYDKISYALGFDSDATKNIALPNAKSMSLQLFPMQVDIPGYQHTASDRAGSESDNGALLFSNIVIASLRSTARASSRLKGCELLLTFGEHLTDEAKLDRVLPFAMNLLDDPVPSVQIAALRVVTQLLSLVNVLSPINAFIFPRYVLPRLAKFVASPAFVDDPSVRATYAACLADLATTASRFLDMTQALRADGSLPSIDPEAEDDVAAYAAYQIAYDVTRDELVQQFENQAKLFLTDPDSAVRRSFLGSVAGLCVFFGDSLASDLILTHLNTYLNDEDWTLRCALCEAIVGVAAFVGGSSLEDFILPLLIQALTDPEETVTEQVIRALGSMASLGLFQKWTALEVLLIVTRFALHPNQWIREAVAQFISSVASHLSYADFRSLVEPLIRPVLKIDVPDTDETTLLDSFKKPLPRPVLDLAKVWVTRTDKGAFWRPAQQAKSFSFDASSNKSLMDLYRGVALTSPTKAHKNDEDDQWMTRLRNAGLRTEDEPKLVALRDYIWRVVVRTEKETPAATTSPYNHVVSLTSLKVPLQNVLFEDDLKYYDQIAGKQDSGARTRTLAEALKEATTATADLDQDGSSQRLDVEGARQSVAQSQEMSRTNSDISRSMLSAHTPPMALRIDGKLSASRAVSGTEQLSSSPASQLTTGSRKHSHSRQRDNAMSLMRRSEASKAAAELSTETATAFGTLDAPAGGRETPAMTTPTIGAASPGLKPGHAYNGNDPTVQRYLESTYISSFPLDVAEFGPRVQPLKRAQITSSASTQQADRWKPQGLLVAALSEHTDQITGMAVSPDHLFFITASMDGTVRVWDTNRLERNITHRARHVHRHHSGAAITAVAFVESTHSFISCAADGSLNVVKVNVSESAGSARYSKLQVLREWSIVPGLSGLTPGNDGLKEHVVAVDHYRQEGQGQSLCLLLTSHSRFVALDLKHMDVLYTLDNPLSHGTPTCFTIHKKRQWLLIGTDHGVLDLWDLRFRLRLRSWTFRNPCAISKISTHPGRRSQHRMRICIAGGTSPSHVSIWDLEKLTCCEVYSTSANGQQPQLSKMDLELVQLDEDKDDSQLERFIRSPDASRTGTPDVVASPKREIAEHDRKRPSHQQSVAGIVQDFVVQMHIPSDNQTSANDARHHFVLTAGPEWKTRYWDVDKLANCKVVNSGAIEHFSSAAPDEIMQVSASLLGADTKVYVDAGGTAQDAKMVVPTSSSRSRSSKSSTSTTAAAAGKQTRYDMIRNSTHHLLAGHRDEITCLALVEKPFGMVVTGDRSGAVYVFQ